MKQFICVTLAAIALAPASLAASPLATALCEGAQPYTLDGFTPGDTMRFLDRADPLPERVTDAVEGPIALGLGREETPGPVFKAYCAIGMFQMAVDFAVPAEDDSIAGTMTRALYHWAPEADPAGWQIEAIGERFICARGRDTETDLCL